MAPGSQPEARVRSLVLDLSLAAHAISRASDMLRDAAFRMKGYVF